MFFTPEQVKGRIKNIAKVNQADARVLMRIYMMERFLERVHTPLTSPGTRQMNFCLGSLPPSRRRKA